MSGWVILVVRDAGFLIPTVQCLSNPFNFMLLFNVSCISLMNNQFFLALKTAMHCIVSEYEAGFLCPR